MRGDTHAGFGGRAGETDPGQPGTAPVPDPTAGQLFLSDRDPRAARVLQV